LREGEERYEAFFLALPVDFLSTTSGANVALKNVIKIGPYVLRIEYWKKKKQEERNNVIIMVYDPTLLILQIQ
jgi:hypothetical protein